MYCPQCGQQQANGAVRFCSRCGFLLDGVIQLLGNGGIIRVYDPTADEPAQKSARWKGVRQGAMLFLSGILIVSILGVLSSFAPWSTFLAMLVPFAALLCFVGGPLRMVYAGIFEEGAPNKFNPASRPYVPAPVQPQQFGPPMQRAALPPPVQTPAAWRPRPITAELPAPPSVTENTTRLLDKDDRKKEQ